MDRKCSICDAPIQKLGFHFNGKPSCPSCRVFFHRNAEKFEKLNCKDSDSCDINSQSNRKKCAKCRLRRCFEIGMESKALNRLVSEVGSNSNSNSPLESPPKDTFDTNLKAALLEELNIEEEIPEPIDEHDLELSKSKPKSFALTPFEQSQIDLINSFASDSFEEENSLELLEGEIDSMLFITQSSSVYARRIVRFCKKFDFFRSLTQDKQLMMLKCFSKRVVPLRIAFQYNPQTQYVRMLGTEDGSHSILISRFLHRTPNSRRSISHHRKMERIHSKLEQDTTIRNLLQACFLTELLHENVYDLPPVIRQKHFHFTHLFIRYLESKNHKAALARQKYRDILKYFYRDDSRFQGRAKQFLVKYGVHNLSDFTAEVMDLK